MQAREGVMMLRNTCIVLFSALAFGGANGEKVKVSLDLTVSGYHAPWFVAQKLGYFTEQGLEVAIGRGFCSGDTARGARVKEVDTGFHHTSSVIISVSVSADMRVGVS